MRAPQTVRDVYQGPYQRYCVAKRYSESYRTTLESVLRKHVLPAVGDVAVTDLTDEHLMRLFGLMTEHSASHCNSVVAALKGLLKVAAKTGLVPRATLTLDYYKTNAKDISTLSPKEAQSVVDACESKKDYIVVTLALEAGLRMSEILALQWGDIDYVNNCIHIRRSDYGGKDVPTKGRKERTVHMTGLLRESLSALNGERTARVLGKANKNWLQNRVRTILNRAGMRHIRGLHILRHTYCTRLAQAGVAIHIIQRLAGHKSILTTQRYLHATDEQLAAAMKKFEVVSPPVRLDRVMTLPQQERGSAWPSISAAGLPTHPVSAPCPAAE